MIVFETRKLRTPEDIDSFLNGLVAEGKFVKIIGYLPHSALNSEYGVLITVMHASRGERSEQMTPRAPAQPDPWEEPVVNLDR